MVRSSRRGSAGDEQRGRGQAHRGRAGVMRRGRQQHGRGRRHSDDEIDGVGGGWGRGCSIGQRRRTRDGGGEEGNIKGDLSFWRAGKTTPTFSPGSMIQPGLKVVLVHAAKLKTTFSPGWRYQSGLMVLFLFQLFTAQEMLLFYIFSFI